MGTSEKPGPAQPLLGPSGPPVRTDLGNCRPALGEGAGISGPSHPLSQKGPPEWEAWQEAVEGPYHCRDLYGEEGRGQ